MAERKDRPLSRVPVTRAQYKLITKTSVNDPQYKHPSAGSASNRHYSLDRFPVVYRERPLSEIIAEENRIFHQRLVESFKGYVVVTTGDGEVTLPL